MGQIMTKILINGRFLARRQTGVDRFAYELLHALDKMLVAEHPRLSDIKIEVLVPPKGDFVSTSFRNIEVRRVGVFSGTLWEQLDLPRFCGGNLLVSLCNTAPLFRRKQIVVVHDAAPVQVPQAYGRAFRLWYRLMVPWLGRWSRSIFTVSSFSKVSLENSYGLDGGKISVLSESGEHILKIISDTSILERKGITRPFVLAVGSLSPHKNFSLVVKAVGMLPDAEFDLVVAGGADPRIFSGSGQILPDCVRYLGYVSDAELRALYEAADCFVFPSLYEGFGLPPLEAMSLGCPVISSDAASLPEVCGDAAVYIDPDDATALAKTLKRVMGDAELRSRMAQSGRNRAAIFTWSNAAELFLDGLCVANLAAQTGIHELTERAT